MRLHTRELGDFVKGSLVIDCAEMVLASNGPNPVVYEGCGSIWRTGDGGLTLKLHCSRRVDITEIHEAIESYTAGEIVPDSAFFSLRAVDIKGQVWSGTHILPDFSSGELGTVISADLRNLSTQRELQHSTSRAHMLLGFDRPVQFPYNAVTKVETTVAGERGGTSVSLNVARFSACDYEFTLQNEEGWLVLDVLASGDAFPSSLDIRICEALQFVLAQWLTWSFREVHEGNKRLTVFRSSGISETNQQPRPPIAPGPVDETGITWLLFDKYLQHIIDYGEEDKLHPLSALVRSVVAATSSALESQALAISVAVEGVLSVEFQRLGLASNTIEEERQTTIRLIQCHPDLTKAFKSRVLGFLGAMHQPRAKDKLRQLVEKGLIEQELWDAWEKTRHPAAHAEFISSASSRDRTNKLFNLCLKVNQLFNSLVFLAIGYIGKYTDYSANQWPLKSFERAIKAND